MLHIKENKTGKPTDKQTFIMSGNNLASSDILREMFWKVRKKRFKVVIFTLLSKYFVRIRRKFLIVIYPSVFPYTKRALESCYGEP